MMIKINDILAAANAKVAEYMADGYMISFGDSSFGYAFRVDLEKNGHYIRVKVVNRHDGLELPSQLVLSVVELPCPEEFERKDAKPLFTKTWYKVNEYSRKSPVFTESLDEITAIAHKKTERWLAQFGRTGPVYLAPSAGLIRSLKRRKGFSNATRKNISVRRVKAGYEVSLSARDGHVSRVEVIKFPQR